MLAGPCSRPIPKTSFSKLNKSAFPGCNARWTRCASIPPPGANSPVSRRGRNHPGFRNVWHHRRGLLDAGNDPPNRRRRARCHWAENWKNIQATASLAEQIGLKPITFHAGFLPHEETDPAFQKLFDRISRIADLFASKNIALGFETGQETAETLRAFLEKLNRPTVGVNFDPANMILYDKGDPIAALRTLGPWLKQCHIKDALKTKQPGTWGEEVVVGTGDVDWHAFLKTLEDLNFSGFCCMEREAGCQRVADIRSARDFIETILACG